MQDYNFDELIDRRNTNCVKWDTSKIDDVVPMWVADMDFAAAPCIVEALRRRVDHRVFGYTNVPESYYEAVCNWFKRRHDWLINPGHIIYTTGVVPALSAVIKALTQPGEKVIVQTPAYNCFFSSVRNNDTVLAANPLLYNSADGSYSIDFDNLEAQASDPAATLMLLCNPHNPSGRVWTVEELRRIAEICKRNGVTVLADEIHCELTYNGNRYNPFALVAEEVGLPYVVACAASKAFNIAGLHIANIIAPDDDMRSRIDRAININEVCDVNPFGVVGLQAAYNDGEPWLDAACDYIYANYEYARSYFAEHLPRYVVTPLQGTYLMWVNISASGHRSEYVAARLEAEGRVKVSPGKMYGDDGDDFIRINLACPRAQLEEALRRIHSVFSTWKND